MIIQHLITNGILSWEGQTNTYSALAHSERIFIDIYEVMAKRTRRLMLYLFDMTLLLRRLIPMGEAKSVWRLESESRKESEKHTQKKKPNAFQILMKFSYLDGKISVSTPKHTATTHICHESECCLMKTSANTNTEIESKIVYESNWQREMLNVECSKDKN